MNRYTFTAKYKNHNYNTIVAVKHCLHPRKTKVYKNLKNMLDRDIIESYGWAREKIDY